MTSLSFEGTVAPTIAAMPSPTSFASACTRAGAARWSAQKDAMHPKVIKKTAIALLRIAFRTFARLRLLALRGLYSKGLALSEKLHKR